MKIKSKLMLFIYAIWAFLPGVGLAHSGHGRSVSNIFHYLIDHASDYFIWLIVPMLIYILFKVGAKNK